MAIPTSTRAEIRRAICLELGMPFFQRYSDGYLTCSTGATSTAWVDTDLTQNDEFWAGGWLYVVSDTGDSSLDGSVRHIDEFLANDDKALIEYPLPAEPSGSTYEIHTWFSTIEIHSAINRAIEESFPSFYDVVQDSTLIYQEDVLTYSLSSLDTAPYMIIKAEMERPSDSITGTATSGAVTYLIDTSADFTSVDTNYKVSIYDGTGKGQIRGVASVTGTTQINPDTNFTTAPDSTSKYRVWDATEEEQAWYRITDCKFDRPEFPDNFYLQSSEWTESYGARIRLTYLARPAALSADTSTTSVPKEYVIARAIEFLSASRIGDSKTDTQKYRYKEQVYKQKADDFRSRNFRRTNTTLWQEFDASSPDGSSGFDPLDW